MRLEILWWSPKGSILVCQSTRLSLQSSKLARPAPTPTSECVTPLRCRGGTHSLVGEGARGANSDKETDTLVLYV